MGLNLLKHQCYHVMKLGLDFLRMKDHKKSPTLNCFLRKADAKMGSDVQDIYWGERPGRKGGKWYRSGGEGLGKDVAYAA